MGQKDKLIVITFVAIILAGAPPLIVGSLPLAIYGFACLGFGALVMLAATTIDRAFGETGDTK